jgi:hypothetical protein
VFDATAAALCMVFPPLAGEKAEESLGARAAGRISRLYPECIHQEKGGHEPAPSNLFRAFSVLRA